MKKNKTKENILSVITLLGIFGLFAYFQFSENPIKTSDNKATKEPINVSDYTPEEDEKYDFKVRFFEDPERKFKVIFLKTFNFSNYLKLHNYVEDAVSYSIYSYVERETGRHED
mgnify:CR=1 FL=1